MELIRRAGNRGKFYPRDCKEITFQIEQFNKITSIDEPLTAHPRAIIAPHAGYIYSGFTANDAHAMLAKTQPKRVIVIGPSHHVYFEGVSAAFFQQYETPCGNLQIDLNYLEKLSYTFNFLYNKRAHDVEHSTETQMPFIRHYHPEASVVELIYGNIEWQQIALVIEAVLSDKENTIVISSDLSHFYPLEQAVQLDGICMEAIKQKDVNLLDAGCEACGIVGIKAMIDVASHQNLSTHILDYRTSADVSGDSSSVVGYVSAVIG